MQNISIIIPLSKDETKHQKLVKQLEGISSQNFEIIFVGCREKNYYHLNQELKKFVYLKTTESRAKQLNLGASKAKGKFIWFLHADSLINDEVLLALEVAIKKHSNSLSYFRLKFYDKPHPLITLNEWGAWIRSHIFKIPFGDQGFFLKKSIFNKLSGFCEKCRYGEDHLFVWKAHQKNIKFKGFNNTLCTSARKYQQQGWSKLTITYQYLWIKQAFPQWIKKCMTTQN